MSRVAPLLVTAVSCGPPHAAAPTSSQVKIDRFSAQAGHLLLRSAKPALPGPDQPIDLDVPPFVTRGLGPDGSHVRYYNFDIQSDRPATRYRFVRAGTHERVAGQPDVVDRIPGDPGYTDFWRLALVELPPGAEPVTRAADVHARGLTIHPDATILDCPVVPNGSTAKGGEGIAPPVTTELWYRGARITCLEFGPALAVENDRVPTSPIYVSFAREGGPFRTEDGGPQTHNVVFSVPGDSAYSPLWAVHIYDMAAFDRVHDATTAEQAPLVDPHGPLVNCPVFQVGR
jgi:hypothetical protein